MKQAKVLRNLWKRYKTNRDERQSEIVLEKEREKRKERM